MARWRHLTSQIVDVDGTHGPEPDWVLGERYAATFARALEAAIAPNGEG